MTKATNQQLVSALYIAVYDRAPETSGFNYWVGELDNGVAFDSIANGFVAHPVFNKTYGNKDNREKIESFYHNILGGPGDTSGINYWTQRLDNGEPVGEVLAKFVTSSIEIDLSTSLGLSPAEWAAAKVRQDTLLNKTEVATYYAKHMGAESELTGDTASVAIMDDPKYQQAVAILAGVTNDDDTVEDAKDWIEDHAPETQWMNPLYTFTEQDGHPVLLVNLNDSFDNQPEGPKELGNISLEDFDIQYAELLNGGGVGSDFKHDKILVSNDVLFDVNEVHTLTLQGLIQGEGTIHFDSDLNNLKLILANSTSEINRLNLDLEDDIEYLTIGDHNQQYGMHLDLHLSEAEGLDVIDLSDIAQKSHINLNMKDADVDGWVSTLIGQGESIHYTANDDATDVISIKYWGFNQLVLNDMDVQNDVDKISFEQMNGINSFDDLQLTQQGDSVMIGAKYFSTSGEIEVVGAQLADLTADDFIF